MATAAPPRPLPRPIKTALGRIDRRLRGVAALRTLGTLGVVAAAVAAAGMAADVAWSLPGAVRWGVWAVWVGVVVKGVGTVLATLLRRPADRVELAALAERAEPGLGERLTGAVGLLEGGRTNGSPGLIAAVVDEASRRAREVDPGRAVPSTRAWRRAAVGAVALACVAVPAVVRPDPFGRIARRFLTPWVVVERVGRYAVTVEPGDVVAALGDEPAVRAEVRPRFRGAGDPGSVVLEWSDRAKTRRRVMEAGEGGGGYRAALPRLAGPVSYRVTTVGGESRWYQVKAVAPPAVAGLTARVEPPAYTRAPGFVAKDPARIEAWEGSRVTLTVAASRAVRSVEVDWPGLAKRTQFAATLAADGLTATTSVTADAAGGFSISLQDGHGIKSRPEPPRRVVVRADQPPTVALRGVEGLDQARADDTLRLGVVAEDDVAVASVELHYKVERSGSTSEEDGASGAVPSRSMEGLGTPSARGAVALPLTPLGLKPGDAVAYRVRVTDNRPAPRGPNVAWSGWKRLGVTADAAPLLAKRSQVRREAVQVKLDALKRSAAENRRETEPLRYAADAVQRGNGVWDADRKQALADREAAAAGVAEGLHALARDLDDDPAYRPLARAARQAAGVEAESARATLDGARRETDPARRLTELRQADTRLGAVSNRLDELQRGLDALARRDADAQKLQALADRQAQVAGHADGPGDAPPDRARLDRAAAEQNAVRKDLDALLRDAPAMKAELLAEHAEEADALAGRARDLAARQRAEARTATDLSRSQGVLRGLAEEQRAIEDDARRLALDVDVPLAENGRGRLNTDPIRQAAAPIERGDVNQGRQRLTDAENELRRLARDLDDAPGDLKALAGRLARRQDRLSNEAIQALGDARSKGDLPGPERAALAARLRPTADPQKAVADLASALTKTPQAREEHAKVPFPRDQAREAADAARRAADAVKAAINPREVEARANEARDRLHRLANDLPDVWRRSEPSRRAAAEARQIADDAINQVDRHLRETEELAAKDPARAAADLANRLGNAVDRARQAAERLDADRAAFAPRVAPQRDRAGRRLRALAEAGRAQTPPPNGFDPARARALRDALRAAAVEARAGVERLEQKLNGQVPADDLVAEIAEELRSRPADESDPARLVAALRSVQAPDAPLELAEALRLAGPPAKPDDGAEKAAAAAVENLAARLNDRQTAGARVGTLAKAERAADPDPVKLHKAVAAELARLPRTGAVDAAADAVRAASDLVSNHDDVSGKPTPDDHRKARARAAGALDALAKTLTEAPGVVPPVVPSDVVPDPDLPVGPGHAARALELARRERRLRERLQAVLGGHVGPQEELRQESAAIGRALADLRDRAKAVSPRSNGPANEAAALLGDQAPRAMEAAAGQLAQGQPDPARESQRRAAELAERGAQTADDLAAALRADRPGDPDPAAADATATAEAKHRDAPNPLAQARESMTQASQRLGQAREPGAAADARASLDQARQAMQAAADRLQAAADAQTQGPGDGPGKAGESVARASGASQGEPKSGRAGTAVPATLPELQEQLRTARGRAWGELPGHLRTEILQMSEGRYRDDYARLIQLYYREIAAPGGRP